MYEIFAFEGDAVREQVGSFVVNLLYFVGGLQFLDMFLIRDEIAANLLDFPLNGSEDRLENILVSEYAYLIFEKVVFDFEMWVSVVILDHTQVELFKTAATYLLNSSILTFSWISSFIF